MILFSRRIFGIGVGTLALLAVVAFGLGGRSSRAQDAPEAPPQVIVTTQGQIVEGLITPNSVGYTVHVAGGQIMIPANLVKLTAASRHDAYLKYLALMPEETAENHLFLARWCVEARLFRDARTEVRKALFLEPEHDEAKQFLATLEQIALAIPEPAPRVEMVVRDRDGFAQPEKTATAGLTPANMKEYVTSIQPIFMNNCAQAGCHHARAENEFRLQYVSLSGRTNRLASDNNLREILRHSEGVSLADNPLLAHARRKHGGMLRGIDQAPRGAEMLARLEAWLANVAPPSETFSATTAQREIIPVSGERQPDSSRQHRTIPPSALPVDERAFVREILNDAAPDRFDPAAFNRTRR